MLTELEGIRNTQITGTHPFILTVFLDIEIFVNKTRTCQFPGQNVFCETKREEINYLVFGTSAMLYQIFHGKPSAIWKILRLKLCTRTCSHVFSSQLKCGHHCPKIVQGLSVFRGNYQYFRRKCKVSKFNFTVLHTTTH